MGFTPFGSPKGRKRRFALRFPPKGEQTANQRGNVKRSEQKRCCLVFALRATACLFPTLPHMGQSNSKANLVFATKEGKTSCGPGGPKQNKGEAVALWALLRLLPLRGKTEGKDVLAKGRIVASPQFTPPLGGYEPSVLFCCFLRFAPDGATKGAENNKNNKQQTGGGKKYSSLPLLCPLGAKQRQATFQRGNVPQKSSRFTFALQGKKTYVLLSFSYGTLIQRVNQIYAKYFSQALLAL